ncbi:MAG: YdiU family protein [Proteobacteria bacterium]|nr:MAG: YdiU family protein [Pseudomonadota bacterium]
MDAPARHLNLSDLDIRNPALTALPGDDGPNRVRQTPGACYSRVSPRAAPAPRLVAVSREMLGALDLDETVAASPAFLEVFSGNRVLDGMQPHAACYGGHQFGHWAGQLGDGRAINLGEVVNSAGEHWMLQLKGAGMTPYSRMADGLAVLRSSVREFLCSEAMHHLGIPTTRALSLIVTGESVVRDMFYDGRPRNEPGAVVCRAAPTFIRFGNFEIHAARGESEILRQLADFTIRTEFPELADPARSDRPATTYAAWFDAVCRSTADLVVHWMRVGFVHGVMNTDNMSILGQTIDYGPYGWLEDYDPNWTPNTTDASGRRYAYGNQPHVALWNLNQLANAIYPLFDDVEPLEAALEGFATRYNENWRAMMASKLGLARFEEDDETLVAGLIELLQLVETDMTLFYRGLAGLTADNDARTMIAPAWYREEQIDDEYLARFDNWIADYRARLARDSVPADARAAAMNRVNPRFVLRNYLAQLAIDAAEQGDYSEVAKLLEIVRHPYDEQPGHESYAGRRPDWARDRPGCSMLSCSS